MEVPEPEMESYDVVMPNDVMSTQDTALKGLSEGNKGPSNDTLVASFNSLEGSKKTPKNELFIQQTGGQVAPDDIIVNQPTGFEGMMVEPPATSNDVIVTQPPASVEGMLEGTQVALQVTRDTRPAGTEGMLVENLKHPREEKRKKPKRESKDMYFNAINDDIEMTEIGAAAIDNKTNRQRYRMCCTPDYCRSNTCSSENVCTHEEVLDCKIIIAECCTKYCIVCCTAFCTEFTKWFIECCTECDWDDCAFLCCIGCDSDD